MHREPRSGAEFVEHLLLPVVNIVFLMIPVLLVVLELASLAALQASVPEETPSAQAPAGWISPSPSPSPSTEAPTEIPSQARAKASNRAQLFPDPMVGYGP
ncbi:hypothetical protein DB30_02292 [Enhygromyxa salina]|uniref:Uncharacterized protein n=1 Tax=Enhygromyxa salina TaxID=215803 RepID=A0A0C1Z2Z0_9BACT|nr:hypothetical protein [Enhygromyxa salina]KIG11909.1 hypothetical protein DB30_02292 [Enhygromyxa salina]